ncbi:ABC transporter substrate-binding protein [Paenibacillus sp. GCM10027628]|uniref:ABC transporter substrate-binding protein n=1 Tax=Paenibacillus sp. GCM10027628 TaxID=3273413 RepID=UPI00364443F6
MKKVLTIALVITAFAALLEGCSGKPANDGNAQTSTPATQKNGSTTAPDPGKAAAGQNGEIKGDITWATHRTELVETDLKKYVDNFKKLYPGVNVKIEGLKDYEQTMRVRMAANELPDVLSLIKTKQEELPKFYEPLDDLGLSDKIYFKEISSFNGKLYGISQQVAFNGLVYNKKAFEKAGITSPPTTLDELFADSAKLKASGIVPMATSFKDGWTLQYWTDPAEFIYGNTGLRNDKIKTDTPFTLEGPYGKGLGILKQLSDKGYLEKDLYSANWDQTQKDIATGKTAMMYIGNWFFSNLIKNGLPLTDIGFAPLPYDNSGTFKGMMRDDWAYAVSATSKNKPAAKAFIKFMLEQSGDYADHMIISPIKDQKQSIPQLDQFMSSKPAMMEAQAINTDVDAIEKKMQFDPFKFIQEAIAKDMKTVFDDYNKKWSTSKAALNK